MQVRPSGHAVDHSDYLMMLQQKNRLLKKMRAKDPQQVEMERKEKGFTLYLNGENARGRKKQGGPLKAPLHDTVLPNGSRGRGNRTSKTTS